MDLRARDGLAVRTDLGDRHAGDALLALDVHDGVAELQRNVKVVEALHDVALQTAGIGQQLRHDQHLRALERHAAGHDEADIAAAEDHDPAAGHIALHIDQPLRRTGRVDARRAVAGDIQRAAAALTAAHGEEDGLRVDLDEALLAVDGRDVLVLADGEDHGVELVFDLPPKRLRDVPRGVFRPGQLLAEGVQAEAVVDALVQNAAQLHVALQNQNAAAPGVIRRDRGRQTGRAAADDDNVIFHFACTSPMESLFVPVMSRDCPPHLVISL